MTDDYNFNIPEDLLEPIIENGFEGMGEVFTILLNEAMKIERSRHIRSAPYERNNSRNGCSNGFKNKTIKSRFGKLSLQIPQVRDTDASFYPNSLEKGMRSERALKLSLAEMYIQGVSTRKVEAITKELCGLDISSSEVSRATKLLDEELKKFRERPLAEFPYLYLDAQYHKVRHCGTVRHLSVLTAIGISKSGNREIVGVSSSLSEAEVHWRGFLEKLLSRGLHGVMLIISDDHAGLRSAKKTVFPSVLWQRCQFHLAQNAQSYVPKSSMKEEIARAVRSIFMCSNLDQAQEQIRLIEMKFEKTAPEFVNWLSENIQEGLTCLKFPVEHQKKIRTVNGLERLHREVKRRTRVVSLFPNEESCLRLITAIFSETNETWCSSKPYLNMKHLYEPNTIGAKEIIRSIT